jgi:hypothetical protein
MGEGEGGQELLSHGKMVKNMWKCQDLQLTVDTSNAGKGEL